MSNLKFGLAWLIIIITPFAVPLLGMNYWEQYKCASYQEFTARKTKWSFMNDCYIKTENGWLAKDEYAAVIIARQGLTARHKELK